MGTTKPSKKITRSRNGCFTCKKRRRKCDETKPACLNCINTGRECGGYGIRLIFDVDDPRNANKLLTSKGVKKYGFRGKPRTNETILGNYKVTKPQIHYNLDNYNTHQFNHDYTLSNSSVNSSKPVIDLPISQTNSEIKKSITSKSAPIRHQPITNSNIISSSVSPIFLVDSLGSYSSLIPKASCLDTALSSTNTVSSTSDKEHELEFDNEQQFEHAFLSSLDYILDNYDNELLNAIDLQVAPSEPNPNNSLNMFANIATSPLPLNIHNVTTSHLNSEVSSNNNCVNTNTQVNNELELDSSKLGPQLKKKEESHILKHFFEKVIYLLDAHPQNPWPQLMMKFGSMDLAKSCFLSLSSMHLYVNNGGDEFYKRGLLHINNTMEYLIKYVKTSGLQKKEGHIHNSNNENREDNELSVSLDNANENEYENEKENENDDNKNSIELGIDVPGVISKLKYESDKRRGTNFMIILLLLYVHILFAVLESGRSALARMFLKLSSSIASDPTFTKKMKKVKQIQPLLCVLSWFDTVAAIVSPDCRIPYFDPKWFGESNDLISTDKMNGCPAGMFRVLYDLSLYRRETMFLFSKKQCDLECCRISHKNLLDLRDRCLHYRDHVLYVLPHGSSFTYIDRLKCSQLWSLACILVTIQLELHYFGKLGIWIEQNRKLISESELPNSIPTVHIYSEKATAIVTEFLSVYNTIPAESPIITQMVWPIFYIGICSYTPENRAESWKCLKTLYETVKMGTIKSNMNIVEKIWNEGCSLESILAGEGWFENGIDLLPC